ncbi:B-cell receptor-associated protein 29 [Bagarius yarrelli]|uniref:B-cell receptor-associated protein 29 n=1 Tax=Bagarius yarrelli TaxID=175774 RepID=A0A556U305_BAGYA|nr:B-cell receptor-associated protein 29 [Bagarius yarrelli]
MRRVITMINQLAVAANTNSALQLQLEDANQAAKKYTKESERLKQALNDSSGDKRTAQENKDLRKEVCKLKQELETSAKGQSTGRFRSNTISAFMEMMS